jgi:hypothetical protein
MLDALILKKSFDLRVLKLSLIVASYLFLSLIRTRFEPDLRIPLRFLGFEIFPAKRITK